MTNKTLILATDGSVPDQVKASFGWILATTEGTRLAHCTGPAYGYSIASYRAEGYGLLSAVRFIHHCNTYYNVDPSITIYCDNESIIKKAQKPIPVKTLFPNLTLEAEADVIIEIWQTALDRAVDADTLQGMSHHKSYMFPA